MEIAFSEPVKGFRHGGECADVIAHGGGDSLFAIEPAGKVFFPDVEDLRGFLLGELVLVEEFLPLFLTLKEICAECSSVTSTSDSMAKIKIDLGDVCMALQSSEEQDWYLDRETGKMHFFSSLIDNDEIDIEEIEGNPDRYVYIESADSRDGFRMMEDFVDGLKEGEASRSLTRALRMRKPFRCFKDTLLDFPEVRDQWFAFHNSRMEELARQFLEEEGIDYEVVSFSGESAD